MRFVAIDVETANPDMSSICQIGMATFTDGSLTDEWSALIDPEDYFYAHNVAIHGIDASMVVGQRKLPEVVDRLRSTLEGEVSVCHTHFDRVALNQAFTKYGLKPIETTWLDSARVARRAWDDFAWRGYGLQNICRRIGYEYKPHDALEDAKAAGYTLIAACDKSGFGIDEWLRKVNRRIGSTRTGAEVHVKREGNPEGDLFGEFMVFTGALHMSRGEAADLAASVGCQVTVAVSKKTTILVVGDQDVTKLAGHEKSSKHRKAEELITKGSRIRIIRESDFRSLVHIARS